MARKPRDPPAVDKPASPLENAERLCAAGENLEIWRVPYTAIREQDLNARVMPPEMLERLTETIRRENRIESLPFGVLREKHVELISGHHRLRAAVSAGVVEIPVLVDTRDLSASQVKAKQLAHNSIAGTDDAELLARIFANIDTVQDRLEAFVDVDLSAALEDNVRALNEEITIEWPVLAITFLPGQMTQLELIGEKLAGQIPKETDQTWLVPDAIAARFTEILNKVGKAENIRTTGNIIARMVELVEAELDRAAAEEND